MFQVHLCQVYKVHLHQVYKSEPPGVQLERGSRRSGRQSWSPGGTGSGRFCISSEASLHRIYPIYIACFFHILTQALLEYTKSTSISCKLAGQEQRAEVVQIDIAQLCAK